MPTSLHGPCHDEGIVMTESILIIRELWLIKCSRGAIFCALLLDGVLQRTEKK
jgi:hypothetical protein